MYLILFSPLILLIAIVLFGYFVMWFDRPRKRVLRNHADKINAATELIRADWDTPEDERWIQFSKWYPEVSKQELAELKEYLLKIQETAESLAKISWLRSAKQSEFKRRLVEHYPELNAKSLRIFYKDAMYFTM